MRYGFVIDQNRCIGCHACTVACKDEHAIPVGVNRTWVKYVEKGAFPHTRRHFAVLRCNHCDDAPCVEICPTAALFRRSNGIVDFDRDRCIGCKSCMQACPYDALYIDPEQHTAAKCNFCAHRVESGLQPACEVVCPTQAILSGDLDDPTSKISSVVATQKVSVRKAHKGTLPKLFYVGVDEDVLEPGNFEIQDTHLWADKAPGEDLYAQSEPAEARFHTARTREVYDVPHPPPWGNIISAYLWTKSIGAGVSMVAAFLIGLGHEQQFLLHIASPLLALIFTTLTTFLLIYDLKRPERFFYLVTKPNPRSWLVLGGYILIAYTMSSFVWLLVGVLGAAAPGWLVWLSALLGVAAAGYTAFLFAQAKGRELWQSPLFLWHLLVHATTAGAAVLTILAVLFSSDTEALRALGGILMTSLLVNLGLVLGEASLTPITDDVKRASRLLTHGACREEFWGAVVGLGILLPLSFLAWSGLQENVSYASYFVCSALALVGVWFFDKLWVRAGQAVPLS